MATTSVTSLLLPGLYEDPGSQTLVASVVGTDATATTYTLNYPVGTNNKVYDFFGVSITLGPWASATAPAGKPTAGPYDMNYDLLGIGISLHCDMSRTVVTDSCTYITYGVDEEASSTTVTPTFPTDAFSFMPVTITAGLENLAATPSATAGATSTTTSTAATATGSAATSSSSASSASASSTASSGAVSSAHIPVGLFGLLASSLALAVVSAF